MGRGLLRLGAAATLTALCACSSSPPGPHAPTFDDLTSAPPAIQVAASAVVLVTMPMFTATAFFISPDGLLITNNHVLGVGVCPVEGCYVQLSADYQRGMPLEPPQTVFVVAKAVDVGLDMAVLQATAGPGGPRLLTPDYLTLDARDPAELQGTHVTVVGQPEGSVKKWAAGG